MRSTCRGSWPGSSGDRRPVAARHVRGGARADRPAQRRDVDGPGRRRHGRRAGRGSRLGPRGARRRRRSRPTAARGRGRRTPWLEVGGRRRRRSTCSADGGSCSYAAKAGTGERVAVGGRAVECRSRTPLHVEQIGRTASTATGRSPRPTASAPAGPSWSGPTAWSPGGRRRCPRIPQRRSGCRRESLSDRSASADRWTPADGGRDTIGTEAAWMTRRS